ncbi:MAG: hypothetical protein ACMXYC_02440 [Candidatus Woesearchaeota archaeon]
MARRDTSQSKWKKKKWVEVVAPQNFNAISLGHTLVEDTPHAVGRVITTNMMNVVKNPRMQSVSMKFKVIEIKEGIGHTHPVGYTMAQSAIKRLVRARRDRIDDSFVVKSKDDVLVRVKPLVITHNNYAGSQRAAVREMLRSHIATYVASHPYATFVDTVVNGTFQKETKVALQKLLPIRTVDMRAFAVVDPARAKAIVQ